MGQLTGLDFSTSAPSAQQFSFWYTSSLTLDVIHQGTFRVSSFEFRVSGLRKVSRRWSRAVTSTRRRPVSLYPQLRPANRKSQAAGWKPAYPACLPREKCGRRLRLRPLRTILLTALRESVVFTSKSRRIVGCASPGHDGRLKADRATEINDTPGEMSQW